MNDILDIELLRTLVVVSESGSFTRAAQRLNRGQSAISMQIKRLEEMTGHQLFQRSGRTVELTVQGTTLLDYARRIIKLNQEALAQLQTPEQDLIVQLGVSDVATYLLPGILKRAAVACPQVSLEIVCDRSWNLLQRLDTGAINVALVTQHAGHKAGQLVRQEPLVWVQARGSQLHLKETIPVALFADQCKYRIAAVRALKKCKLTWRIAYSSANPAGLRAAIDAGVAIGMIAQSAISPQMEVLDKKVHKLPSLPALKVTLHKVNQLHSLAETQLVREIIGAG